jgi:hypothetical protein
MLRSYPPPSAKAGFARRSLTAADIHASPPKKVIARSADFLRLDDAQAPLDDRALAQQAARILGQLGARRPADIPALRALVEGRAALAVADRAAVSAVQALHLPETSLHEKEIGVWGRPLTLKGVMPWS